MSSRAVPVLLVASLIVAGCASDGVPAGLSGSDPALDVASTEPADTGDETAADVGESGDTVVGEAGDAMIGDDVNVTVEASRNIGLAAAVTVTSERPYRVEVTATAPDHRVEVPRTSALATEHLIPLVGMRAESTYALDIMVFDGTDQGVQLADVGSFTTSALPAWFAEHELTIDAERASPGYTIVEFDSLRIPEGAPSNQYLAAYDNDGEVVWYYTNTGALGGVEQTPAGTFNMFYWPFGIREVDMLGNLVGNWRPQPSDTTGDDVDEARAIEGVDPDQVDFTGGAAAIVGNPGDIPPIPVRADWIDLVGVHHENWPMPNGNVLTLSTTVHELTAEQRATFCPGDNEAFDAVSDVAVEFEPSGRVVRTWDLWDAIDIDEFPGRELCIEQGIFAEPNTRDWVHANSVTYDPQRDAVIISARHTNQIVAFDHLDAEGPQSQLRWILGDGATMPLDGEQTYYQHAVEVNSDGSLIIYDNGNFRPGTSPDDPDNLPYSRAVIYDVDDAGDDPADWSATQRWEHVDVEDSGIPAYSTFISDADMLSNGNVLVTHGGIGTFPPDPADPLRILIREVVPDGNSGGDVVWELKGKPGYLTYRAERIETFYVGPEWTR